jgi:hypothetical protein
MLFWDGGGLLTVSGPLIEYVKGGFRVDVTETAKTLNPKCENTSIPLNVTYKSR